MTDYRFPLLRLPENLAIRVLKLMEIFEMLGFSLLSRKTQQLASAIRLKAREGRVEIAEHIEVQIVLFYKTYNFIFYEEPSENLDVTMTSPRYVRMETGWGSRRKQKIYRKTGWTMKNWTDHLFKVFNYRRITAMLMDEDGKYNAKSIHSIFREFKTYNISPSIPQFIDYTECFYNAAHMRILRPLHEITATSEHQIRKILAQHFKALSIEVSITLNDLLVANCDVMYADSNLTEKCVNLFLKDWMKGSFPNLKHLFLFILGGNKAKIIMKGVKYEVNEPARLKKCSKCGDIGNAFEVQGGMDIRRGDGTRASVLTMDGSFQMFVWH